MTDLVTCVNCGHPSHRDNVMCWFLLAEEGNENFDVLCGCKNYEPTVMIRLEVSTREMQALKRALEASLADRTMNHEDQQVLKAVAARMKPEAR